MEAPAALPAWWPPLADLIARRHPVAERTEDWMRLEWTTDAGVQTVQAKCLVVQGRGRVFFTADLCRGDQCSPTEALELGSRLLIGGVILYNGILSIRHVFSEDRPGSTAIMDPARQTHVERLLDETILSLRDDALRIRQLLYARQADRSKAAAKDFDQY
jgi:hypothetical protein